MSSRSGSAAALNWIGESATLPYVCTHDASPEAESSAPTPSASTPSAPAPSEWAARPARRARARPRGTLWRGLAGLCLAGSAWLATPAVAAEDASPLNRVSFRVERTRDVENDWATAVVRATREDPDPARVASAVNEDMRWAIERVKKARGLESRSAGYVTVPVQDPKTRTTRTWRGQQDLVLQGADFALLAKLLGELQSRLELVDLRFSVSPEKARGVEQELVDQVLDAFRARALQVQERLGARGYRIVQVQLDRAAPPDLARGRLQTMAQMEVAPPVLEAGSSQFEASAYCTVELEFE